MPISETQIENGTFRVTRWELEPGDTIPTHVHEHEHEYVVVPLTEGTLWATATDGTETADQWDRLDSATRKWLVDNPGCLILPLCFVKLK